MDLKNKKIVIGISSSIAAYKVIDLIKELRKSKADVHIILTKNASKLVDKKDFEIVSNNKVNTDLFNPNVNYIDYIKKK